MLDVKNPEIRVDEIMQRIQEKVRALRQQRPAATVVAQAAALDASGYEPVDEVLARAQEVAHVGASVPAMTRMRGLRRMVAGAIARAFLRTAQLITRDQRAFNLATLDILRTLYERLRGESSQAVGQRADLAALRADLAALRADLAALRAELASARAETQSRIADLQADAALKFGQVRTSISLQERRLDTLLRGSGHHASAPREPEQAAIASIESAHVWDATYLNFEDEFRGSREEIKQRVAVYLPKFRAAGAGKETAPIFDLGCGRGELLEVLRQEGFVASGVDTNRAAIDLCRQHGLSVELRDAFEALAKMPDGSLGGLAALHLVEHLPFPLVLKLLDEALRVLRSEGVVVFETPNPHNVLVGSANFYIDPTHRNPVHPKTLRHLMEARGLVRLETLLLHPMPPEARLEEAGSELARRFNDYFYGPQDYAIIGYRP